MDRTVVVVAEDMLPTPRLESSDDDESIVIAIGIFRLDGVYLSNIRSNSTVHTEETDGDDVKSIVSGPVRSTIDG